MRFERCMSRRFWMGVAQITRRRDRTFIASLCSKTLFSNSSIWRADRHASSRSAVLRACALSTAPNRAPKTATAAQKHGSKLSAKSAVASAAIMPRAILRGADSRSKREGSSSVDRDRNRKSFCRAADAIFRNPYFSGSKCYFDRRSKQSMLRMSASIDRSIAAAISKTSDTPPRKRRSNGQQS